MALKYCLATCPVIFSDGTRKEIPAGQLESICIHTEFGDRTKYPIVRAEEAETRYGTTISFILEDLAGSHLKVLLPKRYNAVVSETDIQDINSRKVSLCLISRGQCGASTSYILSIEKQDR